MKKTKKFIGILVAFFLVCVLVGKVNADEAGYKAEYGEPNNGKVNVKITFNKELASDFNQSANGWTKKDSKTIEATKDQFSFYTFTATMKDNTQEIVTILTPFQLKKGEVIKITDSDVTKLFSSIKITSDNPNVLKIGEDNSITAVNEGIANITVEATTIAGQTNSLTCKGTVVANNEKTKQTESEDNKTTEQTKNESTDSTLQWTDFSNCTLEWKKDENYLPKQLTIYNDKNIKNHRYYVYVKNDNSAPNIKVKENDKSINETYEKNNHYGTLNEKGETTILLSDVLELNSKSIYVTIVEQQYVSEKNEYVNKTVLSKEVKRPDELSVGNRMKCYFFSDRTSTYLYYPYKDEKSRKVNLKIGTITDNKILRNIKDGKSGCLQDLLTYAKESKNTIYTGTVTLGRDKEITSGMNIVNKAYYYVYMELEDENGKYYPVEDVSLYQGLVAESVGKNLFDYLSSDFKWNLSDDGSTGTNSDTDGKDETIAPSKIPQTGVSQVAIISIAGISCLALGGYLGYRKYRDIK